MLTMTLLTCACIQVRLQGIICGLAVLSSCLSRTPCAEAALAIVAQ